MLIPVAQIRAAGEIQLDYVEITSPVTVNATVEATGDVVITGNSITLDGSTRICVEFYADHLVSPTEAGGQLWMVLWDGVTNLGHFAEVGGGSNTNAPCLVRRFLTPSSGAHQYIVKGFRNTSEGTVFAGSGGAGNDLPAYLRVTRT